MDFLNWMQFDERFRKNENDFYPMRCIVNGEKEIDTDGKKYRVDGFVETPSQSYCIEFNGCRVLGLKIFLNI